MIDVSELIGDPDFFRTIGRRRVTGTTFANEGVASPTYGPAVDIDACVQPSSPDIVKTLPEGVRIEDTVMVFTACGTLQEGDQTGKASDVLIVDGKSYRLIQLEDWEANGYQMAIAERFVP